MSDRRFMPLECFGGDGRRRQFASIFPDLDRSVDVCRNQLEAVTGEGHRRDGRRMGGTMLRNLAA